MRSSYLKKKPGDFYIKKIEISASVTFGPTFPSRHKWFSLNNEQPPVVWACLSKVLPTHCYLLQAPLLPVTYSTMRFSCHFLSDLHWFHSSTLQSLVQWCWILHIFESLTLKFTHTGLIIIHKTLKKHSSCIYEFYEKRHD